ncbi:hypothetical protein FQN60_004302 [Etheostoma spectabile]|uniref:Uncharacterized protein n=1 Tax=Etheostoma spectabile TaxID=54343 RepID=A0A5J5CT77_9PERO|nr:hypothetical protein FQN60_004302 [Etheostoma spectabile]
MLRGPSLFLWAGLCVASEFISPLGLLHSRLLALFVNFDNPVSCYSPPAHSPPLPPSASPKLYYPRKLVFHTSDSDAILYQEKSQPVAATLAKPDPAVSTTPVDLWPSCEIEVSPAVQRRTTTTRGEMKPDGVTTAALGPMETLESDLVNEAAPGGGQEPNQAASPAEEGMPQQPVGEPGQLESQPEQTKETPAPKPRNEPSGDSKAKTTNKATAKTKAGPASPTKTTSRPNTAQSRLSNGTSKPQTNGVAKKTAPPAASVKKSTPTPALSKKPTTTVPATKSKVGEKKATGASPATNGAKSMTGTTAAKKTANGVKTSASSTAAAAKKAPAPKTASATPTKPSSAASPKPAVSKTTRFKEDPESNAVEERGTMIPHTQAGRAG